MRTLGIRPLKIFNKVNEGLQKLQKKVFKGKHTSSTSAPQSLSYQVPLPRKRAITKTINDVSYRERLNICKYRYGFSIRV